MKKARMTAKSTRGQKNPQLNLFLSSGSFLIELTIERSSAKMRKDQIKENKNTPHIFPLTKVLPATKDVIPAKKAVIRIINPILACLLYSLGHFCKAEISDPAIIQSNF